jgi:macrolide transport system ATP-binding/permease protein
MKRVRRFLHRLVAPLTHGRRDINAELETHLELLIEESVRRGVSPAEARRKAILRLGGTESIADSWHEQRVLPLVDTVPRDLRFAIRRLITSRALPRFAS